jgi:pimeloyl-ACP methyl ester carboxylesterase
MTGRCVALLALTACASVSTKPAITEGRTAGGIAYDVRGSGPTVVLIHGGVLDRRMWDREADAWSSRFRVVRYDLRGMGKSADVTGPFSSGDDLAAVLDAVGAPRAHLVGLSLGSAVALDFTLTHPERVDRAAAVAAGMPAFAAPPDKAEWVRGLVMANARLFRQSPTAERRMSPPAMARLAEVRVPTLIIVGENDVRERVTVPGAGHLVNVWDPRTFDRVVLAFLASR